MLTLQRLVLCGSIAAFSATAFGQNTRYAGDVASIDRDVLQATVVTPAEPTSRDTPKRASLFGKLTPSWLRGSAKEESTPPAAPQAITAGHPGEVAQVAYNRRSSLSHRPSARPRTTTTYQPTKRSPKVATRPSTSSRPTLLGVMTGPNTKTTKTPATTAAVRRKQTPAPAAATPRPLPIAVAPQASGVVFATDRSELAAKVTADPALAALAKAPAPQPIAETGDADELLVETPEPPSEPLGMDESLDDVVFATDGSLTETPLSEISLDGVVFATDAESSSEPAAAEQAAPAEELPKVVSLPPVKLPPVETTPAPLEESVKPADSTVAETTPELRHPAVEPVIIANEMATETPDTAPAASGHRIAKRSEPSSQALLPPRRVAANSEPTDRAKMLLTEAHQLAADAASVDDYTAIIQRCRYVLAIDEAPTAVAYANQLGSWSLNCRGEALLEEDRAAEAEADFVDALRANRDCWRADHNLGVLASQRGDYEQARRRFDRTLELNPEFAKAYSNRAALAVQAGDYQAALEDYRRAIETDPDLAPAHTGRGRVCHMLGHLEQGLRHLDAAALLSPDDASIAVARADLLVDFGRYGLARSAYQRAITLDANDLTAFRNLAWLQATCPVEAFRDGEAALANAERASALSGEEDDIVLDTHAAALAAVGRFEEAIAKQRRAIEIAPEADADVYVDRLANYLRGEPFRSQPLGDVIQASYTD